MNLSRPSEAVFNRDLRVGQVLFLLPFASLFTLIGLGALRGAWWAVRSGPAGRTPPNPPRIPSSERQGQWVMFGFVLCWNLLTIPVALMVFVEYSSGEGIWPW